MSKKRIIVYDDQILVDVEMIFGAIREANGDWEQVEKELYEYFEAMKNVVGGEDGNEE